MAFFFSKKKQTLPEEDISISNKFVTESLYKHNLEITAKNKILSILSDLYQTSIQGLEPTPLAEKIVTTIGKALEFELVSIYLSEPDSTLLPLSMFMSERLRSEVIASGFPIDRTKLEKPETIPSIQKILQTKKPIQEEGLDGIWSGLTSKDILKSYIEKAHIKTIAGYPLKIEERIIGIALFSFNRSFDQLAPYEAEALATFANVISIALNTSLLYKQIKETNSKLEDANQKLKELDKQKSEFISFATHQLRGPLTAIKGYTSLIIEGDYGEISKEISDAMKIIYESTQSLIVIVGEYLNISRIQQGKMNYNFLNFDLAALVKETVHELSPNIKFAGLQLILNVPEGDYLINADKGKIKEVLSNLIDNSVKYTKKGSLTVGFSAEKDIYRVTIKDTGIGIRPETLPLLFKEFSRASDASKTNIMGTGLGLYVAKSIIEAHPGGKIWAESEGEGKGSTFTIELKKA